MKKECVMVIRASKRRENVDALQKVLTKYGCNIKMRLGLHEAGDVCSDDGLIILHLTDADGEVPAFKKALKELAGIRFDTIEI